MKNLGPLIEGYFYYFLARLGIGYKPIEEISKHRMSICDTCPYNVFNECQKCGCFLELKTRVLNERCPDKPKKW